MSGWSAFFAAQAGVFAALTGLVFVALSINLKVILQVGGLASRAAEAIILLVAPVLTGLAGLVPRQSGRALGVEMALVGVASWAAVTTFLISARQDIAKRPLSEILIRVSLVQLATLPFVAAGVLLLAGQLVAGLDLQAVGVAMCLIAGVVDAWVLLVEILR